MQEVIEINKEHVPVGPEGPAHPGRGHGQDALLAGRQEMMDDWADDAAAAMEHQPVMISCQPCASGVMIC